MTIYLYVKTHNKTGLKYLGKTSKNPHTYLGSGIDWKAHLKEHGIEHTTQIIKECQSNQELSEWGRHYSKLWNVAESDEWANRIPETGGGVGFISGESHYLYDHTCYLFENIKTKKVVNMTQNQLCVTYGLSKGNVCRMLRGDRNRVNDWRMHGSSYQSPLKYIFKNITSGIQIEMTASQFCKVFNIKGRTRVYNMVRTNNSQHYSVNGWRVVWPVDII